MLTSLGVGMLAGLLEACWPYLLPTLGAQWRAALPASAAGLLSFCTAAVVTDALLVVCAGSFLLLLLRGLARILPVWRESGSLHVLARAAILGGTACYLFNGWLAFFILDAGDQHARRDRVIAAIGTVTLLMLAFVGSITLEIVRRRWRLAPPAAVWCAAIATLLAATVWSYWRYGNSPEPSPPISLAYGGPRPNILLVTLDTLRADYVRCYGHPWIETPTLDQLAADGAVFDAAIAQAPSTTPSHCSIMTSVYPVDHGAENGRPMRSDLVTLAEVLRAHGYETVAFTSATTTRSINTGLQKGFDRYVDSLVPWSELFGCDEFQHLIFFYLAGFAQHTQIPGEIVTNRALRWLENRSEKPFFTWLHYFDPHEPYGSPPPFRDKYRGKIKDGLPMAAERELYAEDITNADFQLGRFIDALRRADLYGNTLIVVTSDHGEAFGEAHAHITETGHGHYLSDVTQRVPLVIKPAGAPALRRRIAEQVELIDLAPTVLGLLHIDPPRDFRGNSFAALLDSRYPPYADRYARAFNVVHVARPGAENGVLYVQQLAIRTSDWKYIARPRLGAAELYNLHQDPSERYSLTDRHADIAGRLRAQVMPFWDRRRETPGDPREGLAPTLVRELQALGYLGDSDHE